MGTFSCSLHSCEVAETRSKEDQGHNFAAGDNIEVSEGELMHLRGKVMTIDGNKITILPQHEDLSVCFIKSQLVFCKREKTSQDFTLGI